MNTRIAVPLSREAYDAISLLCKISGVSRGKFLADTLEAAIPGFIKIADAYRAAAKVEGAERDAILNGMQAAERHLMHTLEAVDLLTLMEGEGRSSAPAPNRQMGEDERRSDPPILTGGFPTSKTGGQDEI